MSDFREEAVRRSREMLGNSMEGIADGSFCLPMGVKRSVLRSMRFMMIFSIVFAILLMVTGLLLMPPEEEITGSHPDDMKGFIAAMAGFFLLFYGCFYIQLRTKGLLGKRYRELVSQYGKKNVKYFGLEDASTYQKMKVIGEDNGYLVVDPELKALFMEGLLYRYVVRLEDIKSCQVVFHGSSHGVRLAFDVFGTTLDLVLSQSSFKEELKKQTVGLKKIALYEYIQKHRGAE